MAGPGRVNRQAIIEVARRLISARGVGELTYQVLADELGVTKQAIIYWYPSKAALARDLVLPALQGEVDALIAAVAGASSPAVAIERFVRALVDYHLADLSRFRLVYLAGQVDRDVHDLMLKQEALDEVHRVTGNGYAALEQALSAAAGEEARRLAVAVHMSGVGLITMLALGASIDDPLKHRAEVMVETLVRLLTGRIPMGKSGSG